MSAASGIRDQVFVLRGEVDQGEWRVAFAGRVEPATFNSRGAAQAYLEALLSGTRKPEAAPAADAAR